MAFSAGLVDKTYGDAFFELMIEEDPDGLTKAKDELNALKGILDDVPELVKLSKTPTVTREEKLGIVESAFKDRLSEYSYNFLRVLTEAGRLDHFDKICAYFSARCNDHLGIAEVTAVTAEPLSESAKKKLAAQMEKRLGKKVIVKEETDASIIGGMVVKYEGTTLDGSVKAKLIALKNEIGSVVC